MCSVPDETGKLGTVAVFCSYSHRDDQHRRDFEAHVAMLKRENLIQVWQDRKILAGDDWAGEIDSHLNSADIVTLLVSADFLNSDYCYEKEMMRALERNTKEKTPVVPIIVRPCDWATAPFSHLQAVPTNGKAVTSWENRDEAWTVVANSLRLTVQVVIERLQANLAEVERRSSLLSVEESVAFIFDTDNPEAIENQKQKAYAWARKNRSDRSQALGEIRRKIDAIQQEVFSGAGSADRQTYERWYEYLKSA